MKLLHLLLILGIIPGIWALVPHFNFDGHNHSLNGHTETGHENQAGSNVSTQSSEIPQEFQIVTGDLNLPSTASPTDEGLESLAVDLVEQINPETSSECSCTEAKKLMKCDKHLASKTVSSEKLTQTDDTYGINSSKTSSSEESMKISPKEHVQSSFEQNVNTNVSDPSCLVVLESNSGNDSKSNQESINANHPSFSQNSDPKLTEICNTPSKVENSNESVAKNNNLATSDADKRTVHEHNIKPKVFTPQQKISYRNKQAVKCVSFKISPKDDVNCNSSTDAVAATKNNIQTIHASRLQKEIKRKLGNETCSETKKKVQHYENVEQIDNTVLDHKINPEEKVSSKIKDVLKRFSFKSSHSNDISSSANTEQATRYNITTNQSYDLSDEFIRKLHDINSSANTDQATRYKITTNQSYDLSHEFIRRLHNQTFSETNLEFGQYVNIEQLKMAANAYQNSSKKNPGHYAIIKKHKKAASAEKAADVCNQCSTKALRLCANIDLPNQSCEQDLGQYTNFEQLKRAVNGDKAVETYNQSGTSTSRPKLILSTFADRIIIEDSKRGFINVTYSHRRDNPALVTAQSRNEQNSLQENKSSTSEIDQMIDDCFILKSERNANGTFVILDVNGNRPLENSNGRAEEHIYDIVDVGLQADSVENDGTKSFSDCGSDSTEVPNNTGSNNDLSININNDTQTDTEESGNANLEREQGNQLCKKITLTALRVIPWLMVATIFALMLYKDMVMKKSDQ